MATITVTKQIAAPAERIWALLADFANVDWIPGAGVVEVEGDGPGMQRRIGGSGATPIVETLRWIRPEQCSLSYEIADSPMPVKRFLAVVTVAGDGEASTAKWDIDYEPVGDDAEARTTIEAIYGLMADWLSDAARER